MPRPSPDIGEQCYLRALLALSSPKTLVQAVSELTCVIHYAPERRSEAHRELAEVWAKLGEPAAAVREYEAYARSGISPAERARVEVEIRKLRVPSSSRR